MIESHCYSRNFQEIHISKTIQIMNHDNVTIIMFSLVTLRSGINNGILLEINNSHLWYCLNDFVF